MACLMKIFLKYIFLFVALPVFSFSQQLKLVKDKSDLLFVLQYHVLAANRTYRQGLFQKFIAKKMILVEEGYYQNNLMDSTWTRFDDKGRITERGNYLNDIKTGPWKDIVYNGDTATTVSEGSYVNGKRAGLWIFKNASDAFSYKYDFIQKKVVEYGSSGELLTIIDQKDTITATLEKPAIYVDGMDSLMRKIAQNIKIPFIYPKKGEWLSMKKGSFKILLSFNVNENGQLEDYTILRGSMKEYNDEALRVIKLCDDGNWIPAYYKGHAVKTIEVIPVVFNVSYKDMGTTIVY
jgi:antitoxin component YwqK of YwqJK toxin-antitoxin module